MVSELAEHFNAHVVQTQTTGVQELGGPTDVGIISLYIFSGCHRFDRNKLHVKNKEYFNIPNGDRRRGTSTTSYNVSAIIFKL